MPTDEEEFPKTKYSLLKFIQEVYESMLKNHIDIVDNTVKTEVEHLFQNFKDKIRRKTELNSEILQKALADLKKETIDKVKKLEDKVSALEKDHSSFKKWLKFFQWFASIATLAFLSGYAQSVFK